MRRRATGGAVTHSYLSRFLRAVADSKLPGHSAELLFFISDQPDGRVMYSVAALGCELTKAKMDRAVRALLARRLIVRVKDPNDRRRKLLQVTEPGEGVIGKIHNYANLAK